MTSVLAVDLGLMDYAECFALQKRLLENVANSTLPDLLIRVEHPPVYTLGANFHEENLPLSRAEYERLGVAVEPTDRGGDITYHGPNQLVVYPIFNLKRYGQDLHKWLRDLEESVIVAADTFGLSGRRFPPNTGVWVEDRKIAAIGIKVRRWTSMHGIALNCDNDLAPFQWIVPCGIVGYGVTSLTTEIGRAVSTDDAWAAIRAAFEKVFNIRTEDIHTRDLMDRLSRLESNVARDESPDDSASLGSNRGSR